jgi:hypothetical protein
MELLAERDQRFIESIRMLVEEASQCVTKRVQQVIDDVESEEKFKLEDDLSLKSFGLPITLNEVEALEALTL